MSIEVREEGKTQKIFKDGQYCGEVTKTPKGFSWRNLLADRIKSSFTQGEAKTQREAFAMLGFKLK